MASSSSNLLWTFVVLLQEQSPPWGLCFSWNYLFLHNHQKKAGVREFPPANSKPPPVCTIGEMKRCLDPLVTTSSPGHPILPAGAINPKQLPAPAPAAQLGGSERVKRDETDKQIKGREDPYLAPDVPERVHQTYTVFNNSCQLPW